MPSKDFHRLEMILDSIDKILDYTQKFRDPDSFNEDIKTFDASMMNFIIIGEMVMKLSEDFKMQYNSIDWVRIKAFRNIVAHDYFGIDAEEVWQIIQNDLPALKKEVQTIMPSR